MTIESEFLVHRKEKIVRHKNLSIGPGSSHTFDDIHSQTKITAALDHTQKRGSIILTGYLGDVYAIKYFGNEDKEGEIMDLTEGRIEMVPGDEVDIIKPSRTHTKELIFYHEEPSDDKSTLPIPDQGIQLEK